MSTVSSPPFNSPPEIVDLIFSEDDDENGGEGWYWHAYWNGNLDAVSVRSWRTEEEARAAMAAGEVTWS